jgi:integrase
MRSSTLKPALRKERESKGLHAWAVNVPPHLSPTGKRQQLFFATKSEASAECDKLKTRKSNFGSSLNLLTPARMTEAAEAYRLLDGKVALLEAVRAYLKTQETRTESVTFGEAFAAFAELKRRKSEKYVQEIRHASNSFASLQSKMVCDISPKDIEPLLPKAPSARNAKMRRLRTVFNLAIKRGWMPFGSSPITRMDFADIESKEVEVYTVDETERMLRSALENDRDLLPFLIFGFFCGIRPDGELQKLNWSDVHLDGGHPDVAIPANVSKIKRRRFPKLTPNAVAWIEAYRAKGGSTNGKLVPFSKSTLKRKRAENRKAANVRSIQDGMRHTFCSMWLPAFKDVDELVLQSGHRDADTMWEHYHRGVTEVEAQRFWNIKPN